MPVCVISRGKVVVDKGTINVEKGSGKFIPRQAWCSHVYDRVVQRDKVSGGSGWSYLMMHCRRSINLKK